MGIEKSIDVALEGGLSVCVCVCIDPRWKMLGGY